MVAKGDRQMSMTEPDSESTTTVTMDVIQVDRVNRGSLLALASVVIDIGGIEITVHGIQVRRVNPKSGKVVTLLPTFRGPDGDIWPAVELPEEVNVPLGNAVFEAWHSEEQGGGTCGRQLNFSV